MSQRRRSSNRQTGGTTGRHLRLVLETLEQRRLLAGINVSVFLDQNGTRDYEPLADAVAVGRLVYVDTDFDGSYTPGEPVAITDAAGEARFDNLPTGDYSIGLITNNKLQPQVSPSRVSESTELISSGGGVMLLADSQLNTVWTVSELGTLTPIWGGEPSIDRIELGGTPVTSALVRESEAIIAVQLASGGQQLGHFELESGQWTELTSNGLPQDASLVQMVSIESGIAALYTSAGQSYLTTARWESNAIVFAPPTPTLATSIASNASSQLLVVQPNGPTDTLRLLDASQGFSELSSLQLSHQVSELAMQTDVMDGIALVALDNSTVQAIAIGPNGLSLAAILNQASAPFDLSSSDGRIVTGSTMQAGELVVWDTASWAPIGRSQLPASSRIDGRSQLIRDRRGDRLIALDASAAYTSDLSIASTQRVSLAADELLSVSVGIRRTGDNALPEAVGTPARSVTEDSTDRWNLLDSGAFVDLDGDRLWFSVAEGPAHGQLEIDLDGTWSYEPDDDFYGEDSSTVLVHDGMDTTEIVVRLNVEPENDLPEDILIDLQVTAEDTAPGTRLGYVTIVDVDRDAEYRVTTSDPRFEVQSGELVLAEGGLNFEDQSSIVIQIMATDVSDEQIQITRQATVTLADVNEAPTGLKISNARVDENSPGASIGMIEVEDEDAGSNFDFSVDDPRFIVVDGQLRLVDGQSLDHETEPVIYVSVRATDRDNPDHTVTREIAVAVENQNDAPSRIEISRLQIETDSESAVVGYVRVVDADSDFYQFSVSDARFVVSGNELRLRDGQTLDRVAEPALSLEITAQAQNGDSLSQAFQIAVVPNTPYHNPTLPGDVNGDGEISPIDALILINEINREGGRVLNPPTEGGEPDVPGYPDVNGDNRISPIDVLLIINHLNQTRDAAEGESPQFVSDAPPVYGPQQPLLQQLSEFENDEDKRRIDSQLESLLDDLSSDRASL